ncbi:MAG: TetR/AcrR family transcriptional regulator [Castellaniella sp.]|uniref:TetR/AcrR family transcriptional regulator n=1 Tax=Castellaniella sp. TaxID=1955812 RepID=UPI0012143C17|nr:TetR/AcrR family transcriptional regulator [Castellaniella sp.]TAN28486.1 MAG: TetR/AcrR family transcriptional regulator [Castellaniella sp.]
MPEDFERFKAGLSLSRDDIYSALLQENHHHIRIKKPAVAIQGLASIVEATLRLAGSKGFHAMSLRDLCAESGFSIGGIYAYIKNKEDLIHLIQDYGFLLTRRTLRTRTQDAAPGVEKLRAAVRTHLFLSEMMPDWFSFSFMEARHLPPPERQKAVQAAREIEDIFFDILQEGMAAGAFRHVDARLLASLTKALMQDWYLKRSKYRRQEIDVNTYAQSVCDLLESYLQGPP